MDSVKTNAGDSFVGRVLDGQYEIEALIARGGMGAVYRARHTMLGDRVAIKVLRPDMQTNREWLARFQREGQAARRFRHPNAVTVYDLRQTSDGAIYMVMELVEGRTLDAELKRRGRLTPAEALAVLEPVASTLDAAHRMGIIHRDLKPENIMIGGAEQPTNHPLTVNPAQIKLLDLGIAKMREAADAGDGARQLTVMGQLLGTPYYMSPEQWGEIPRDGNPEIDGRADIYSLGVILYELLAGRKPFMGNTLAEVRRGHTSAPPPPLSEAAPHLPASLSHIVARALAKDRADRHATAGEIIDEMRVAIALSPSTQASQNQPTLLVSQHDSIQTIDAHLRGGAGSAPEALRTQAQTPAFPTNPAGVPGETVSAYPSHTQSPSTSAHTIQPPTGHYQAAGTAPQTFGQFQTPSLSGVHAAQPRRSRAIPIVVGVVLLFLLGGAVIAGLAGWYYISRSGEEQTNTTPNQNNATPSVSPSVTATRTEMMSYWMDFYPPIGEVGTPVRMSGPTLRVRSGQQFQFFIAPRESGYLYIIAPGERNVLTTFLTAQPDPQLQVESNRVEAGETFAFPGGVGLLQLEGTPGTEIFTIIFSREPLTSPAFLADASLRRLSPAELRELENFRAQYETNRTTLTATNEDGDRSKPLTNVSVNGENGENGNQPMIFDIAIQHYN
jgi:eukaryotic-like serine/threonine-protein kinase